MLALGLLATTAGVAVASDSGADRRSGISLRSTAGDTGRGWSGNDHDSTGTTTAAGGAGSGTSGGAGTGASGKGVTGTSVGPLPAPVEAPAAAVSGPAPDAAAAAPTVAPTVSRVVAPTVAPTVSPVVAPTVNAFVPVTNAPAATGGGNDAVVPDPLLAAPVPTPPSGVDVGALAGLPELGSLGTIASSVPDPPAAARALLSTGTGRSVAVVVALLLAILLFLSIHRRVDRTDAKLAMPRTGPDVARFR